MELDVFEFVEKTSQIIIDKESEIKTSARYLRNFFMEELRNYQELISVQYRIKSKESIEEKILRQNYYLKSDNPSDIFDLMPDIIGIRIECRFNDDERALFNHIKRVFNKTDDFRWYYNEDKKDILL